MVLINHGINHINQISLINHGTYKPWYQPYKSDFPYKPYKPDFPYKPSIDMLVGGLVAIFYFPIYWVANHPN